MAHPSNSRCWRAASQSRTCRVSSSAPCSTLSASWRPSTRSYSIQSMPRCVQLLCCFVCWSDSVVRCSHAQRLREYTQFCPSMAKSLGYLTRDLMQAPNPEDYGSSTQDMEYADQRAEHVYFCNRVYGVRLRNPISREQTADPSSRVMTLSPLSRLLAAPSGSILAHDRDVCPSLSGRHARAIRRSR